MSSTTGEDGLIPLVVIGGYLGAGKTTLINELLVSDHGMRLAVVVNDIGAVNIDADLIRSRHGDTYELTNGCICCSLTDDLDDTLAQITTGPRPVDAVIIEASGVAEPGRLHATGGAWFGSELRTVAVVADASTIRERVEDRYVGDLVRRQLDDAHMVILNKADLVSPNDLVAVASWVGAASTAEVVLTDQGRLDLHDLIAARSDTPITIGSQGASSTPNFSTLTIENDRLWDRETLGQALDALHCSIVRVKGPVRLVDAPNLVVAQAVGRNWNLDEFTLAPATMNQLVFVSTGSRSDLETHTRSFR